MHIYGSDGLGIFHINRAREQQVATARLIAAAPDLYAAVERALRHAQNIGVDSEGSSYVNTLRAALAKAQGSQS